MLSRFFGGAALALVVLTAGCGRTVSEDDCTAVAEHMREVWETESKKAAPKDGVAAAKAAAVISAEGDKVVGEWTTECKKELLGRRVDPGELDCILSAETIESISNCGKKAE